MLNSEPDIVKVAKTEPLVSFMNNVETDGNIVSKSIGDDNSFKRTSISKGERFENEISIYSLGKTYIPELVGSEGNTIFTKFINDAIPLEEKIKNKSRLNLVNLEENLIDLWGAKEELDWDTLIQDFDSIIQKTKEIWNIENWDAVEQKIYDSLTQHKEEILKIGNRRIHGDLWANNVLCQEDKFFLIDFEFSQKNTPLIDLGTFYLYSKPFGINTLFESSNISNKLSSLFAIYRILWVFSNIDKASLDRENQNYFHSFTMLQDQFFEELFWLDQTNYHGQNNLLENHKLIQESNVARIKNVVLPIYEDKVCLLQRKSTDTFANIWEFPGGKMESEDKDLLESAKRELKEEIGIEGDDWKFLYYHTFLEDSKIVFVAYFEARINQIPNMTPEHQSMQILSKVEAGEQLNFLNSKLALQLS